MLVLSDRHRPADLALWAEYEAADRVHGERLTRSGKVEAAIGAIREFAAKRPCYVGFSGGKDSSVTLDLVRRAGVDCPAVYLKAIPHGNPDCMSVADVFGGVEVIEVDYRPIPRDAGHWQIEREKDRIFFGACDELQRRLGRRILGIRGAESRARQLRIARWGLATENTLAPIGRWTTADVFGYASYFGVPLHPAYAMLGGGRWPRERLRVDELGGERGDGSGRREWELEYYGDVLRRIEAGR